MTSARSRRRLIAFAPLTGAALLLAATLYAGATAFAQGTASESRVKAAYVLRFAQFLHWPAGRFKTPGDTIHIGIVGRDPFGEVIDSTLAGRVADGHPLDVRRVALHETFDDVDLLFVGRLRDDERRDLLRRVAGRELVTVGEDKSFLADGGGIALLHVGETIRFGVNVKTVQQGGVRFDARALASAYELHER